MSREDDDEDYREPPRRGSRDDDEAIAGGRPGRSRRRDDDEDYDDDRPRRRRRRYRDDDDDDYEGEDIGQNAGMRMLLPVGRSVWAIVAGYMGLLSVLCFPAPIALITGIIAVIDIKRNPKKHGMGRAIFGIIMGGLVTIGLIVAAVAALLQRR